MYMLVHPRLTCLMGISELRMKILGYNTWLHKYIAFIIAGAFGGLSGVLWAHTAGIVSPVNVELAFSVDALLMAVLGGSGTLVGGVIGAFIVFGLREYLSTLVPWWQYVLGAVYVFTILYLPTGLMGIPERLRQRRALTGNREEEKMAPVALTCARESHDSKEEDRQSPCYDGFACCCGALSPRHDGAFKRRRGVASACG
jgi:branched-chain amino acid transport system permease protein